MQPLFLNYFIKVISHIIVKVGKSKGLKYQLYL